jgi:glycosyltransferase involved in cell wall biosynthesis
VLKLADDADARENMGAAARAYVERTASPRGVAQAYADLFKAVARRK